MKLHENLFIEGEIDERYRLKPEERAQGKKAPFNFKIRQVSLLGNVSADKLKGFSINLDSTQLNENFRKSLVKLLKAFPGKTRLSVYLFDAATGYRVELFSKKFPIGVCTEFITGLERLGISYQAGK